ncbi:MAG: hypothetical protein ABSH29_25235 [Acidimicrobiales bacterium]
MAIEDEKEGIRARAVILEIRALISEAIDTRLWAIRGVRNVLEQDQAAAADDERKVRLAASAGRAIAHVNAMTIVAIYGGIEDLVETMGAGLYPIVLATNPDKRQAIFQHNRLRNIELKEAGELSKEGAQALTKFTKTLADALLPTPKRKPNPELPSADGWEDLLKDVYMRPVPERPLPDDLRLTLNELGAVRNVLLHRMGRMDEKALSLVSEGPWRAVNELVVIDDSLYRRYIAALIAYERDLEDRIRSQMGVGLQSDTTSWRTMVPPGDPTSVILQTMDSEA